MTKWIEVMDLGARDRDIKMCGDAGELECGTFIPVKAVDRITVEAKDDQTWDMFVTIHVITGQTYIAGDALWLQRDLIGYKIGMDNEHVEARNWNRYKRDVIQNLLNSFTNADAPAQLNTWDIADLAWTLFDANQERYGVEEI